MGRRGRKWQWYSCFHVSVKKNVRVTCPPLAVYGTGRKKLESRTHPICSASTMKSSRDPDLQGIPEVGSCPWICQGCHADLDHELLRARSLGPPTSNYIHWLQLVLTLCISCACSNSVWIKPTASQSVLSLITQIEEASFCESPVAFSITILPVKLGVSQKKKKKKTM